MQIDADAVIAAMTVRIGELERQSITYEVLANQVLAELGTARERIAELEAASGE